MGGRLAVDTNAVIAYREAILTVCTLIQEADTLFLPVIVLGELLYGAVNSVKPQKNEQAVHKFSAQSVLVPIDEAIAIRYATVRLELKRMGNPIPENDLWIGATRLELGVPLLTRDGHFDYIHGLEVINWEGL
ncbi:type II toxin-antitoxin system VapC family toxin [Dehalococcoidia bacterium]|nr:type II toxin-antitoxin system VapC family toxin [Dehalococcoidia bacterium]